MTDLQFGSPFAPKIFAFAREHVGQDEFVLRPVAGVGVRVNDKRPHGISACTWCGVNNLGWQDPPDFRVPNTSAPPVTVQCFCCEVCAIPIHMAANAESVS